MDDCCRPGMRYADDGDDDKRLRARDVPAVLVSPCCLPSGGHGWRGTGGLSRPVVGGVSYRLSQPVAG